MHGILLYRDEHVHYRDLRVTMEERRLLRDYYMEESLHLLSDGFESGRLYIHCFVSIKLYSIIVQHHGHGCPAPIKATGE
jgi:hypothetical protein